MVLIDGSGFIFRAFYGLPPMTRDDGTPVNAVYGFTNMLMKLLRELDADRIAVIFDHSGTTFRNDIYPQYKANRSETPEELIPQFPLIREATRAFNLPCIEKPGLEADDIIATYARLARVAGAVVVVWRADNHVRIAVAVHVARAGDADAEVVARRLARRVPVRCCGEAARATVVDVRLARVAVRVGVGVRPDTHISLALATPQERR